MHTHIYIKYVPNSMSESAGQIERTFLFHSNWLKARTKSQRRLDLNGLNGGQVKGEDKIMAPEEVSSMVLTKMKETPPRKIHEAVMGVDPKHSKTANIINHAINHPKFI